MPMMVCPHSRECNDLHCRHRLVHPREVGCSLGDSSSDGRVQCPKCKRVAVGGLSPVALAFWICMGMVALVGLWLFLYVRMGG